MKAVNLIPESERRGAGGAAGRSGGAVYVLLGALAVLVVLVGFWVSAGRQADERRTELAQLRAQADAAQAKADGLAPYSRFASVAESRLQTVQQLASSRFDWSHALREVGRVLPEDIALEGMEGAVGAPAATAAATPAAGSTGPTLKLSGCTPTRQQSVARLMARLRQIDGVERVALESSAKEDSGGTAGAGSAKGCTTEGTGAPKFTVNVTFGAVPVDPAGLETPGATTPATTPTAGSTP